MPITDQYTDFVHFDKLKNLRNVDLDFSEGKLTAIMGVNGSGKSTILHALACCYRPLADYERKDYRFIDFFPPNTYALWNDSFFTMHYQYRNGRDLHRNVQLSYQKRDRWTPKYARRPERHVVFLGIGSCVPDIEHDNSKSFIHLNVQQQNDETSRKIKTICSYILDIPYAELAVCVSPSGKEFLGVSRANLGYCTSLSMGAGEQRVFKIIEAVLKCPKYSMILIDEIDLLLHDNALKRLVQKLSEITYDQHRQLQIIFTTHSMLMNELTNWANIRYIIQTPEKTLVQTYISTDSIKQLTGEQERPLKIYVEDKLSQAIINQICYEIGCKRFVSTYIFGPAINAFTILGGKELNNELADNTIAVLDGDVYASCQDKLGVINKVVTGQAFEEKRQHILQAIVQYDLPENIKPEKYIRDIILELSYDKLQENNEFRIALNDIGVVDDDHKYIADAIQRLDLNLEVGLSKVIELAARSDEWENYTLSVRQWIERRLQVIA